MGRATETPLKSARRIRDIPQAVAPPDDLHEETHDSEFSEDSEEFSDYEGSDYENSRKKGNAPPAKKAKKGFGAAQTTQSSAKGSRQKKSLSLLPAMPLDVLFEVFSHLTPKDIIHLSRTSRIFRDTLMMRNATSVWKAARERFGAPECPSNMSEPQWAVLLFGNLCQSCGAKNIPRPEFSLLRRVCINCKKDNFLVESKFKTRFPDVNPAVLELIPFTNVGAWSHGYARSSRFFWISDINAMLQKLAEYQHDIHLRRPGAQKALEDFKAQTIGVVAEIHKLKREREQWSEQFAMGRYNDKQAVIDQRFESITSKFIEMGYRNSDVAHVRSTRECQQAALLTDRIWNRIRPILEPMVLERKKERLEREMREIRSARRAIVHASYKEYQKTLMPSQWKYLPRTIDICAMEPFAAVVDAEGDATVTAADFEDAFRQLPELITSYSDARKLQARSLLKLSTAENYHASSAPEPGELIEGEASSSSSSLRPDPLDLATAAFTCGETSCNHRSESYLFGWDDIAQHHCKMDLASLFSHWIYRRVDDEPGPLKVHFSAQGSEIAAAVVRAAGLDDKVATVSDMDAKAKDIRFGCSVCPPLKRNATSWINGGYKWREFVLHCTLRSHNNLKNVLVVLPPDIVTKVKEIEMTSPHRSRKQWTCGHCTVHFGDLKFREIVVEHLKFVHGIDLPREPEDLFLFERNSFLLTFEAGYLVDSPASVKTLRCLQCAQGTPSEQQWQFDINGVKNHLNAKHNVVSPVVGLHYC